jgi:hypothetical protein
VDDAKSPLPYNGADTSETIFYDTPHLDIYCVKCANAGHIVPVPVKLAVSAAPIANSGTVRRHYSENQKPQPQNSGDDVLGNCGHQNLRKLTSKYREGF